LLNNYKKNKEKKVIKRIKKEKKKLFFKDVIIIRVYNNKYWYGCKLRDLERTKRVVNGFMWYIWLIMGIGFY